MDKYRLIKKRGEGTFAEVWEVEDQKTGDRAALKVLKKTFKSLSEVSEDVEFRVLKLFSTKNSVSQRHRRHAEETSPSTSGSSAALSPRSRFNPHIAGLHDAFFEPKEGKVVFVLELLGQSLLEEILERKKARLRLQQRLRAKGGSRKMAEELPLFREGELRVLLYQILSGIHIMHTRGIFHRDIKPENILFQRPGSSDNISPRSFASRRKSSLSISEFVGPSGTDTLRLKLADFGSSQFIAACRQTSSASSLSSTSTSISSACSDDRKPVSCYTEYIATRWYRSPECLLTSGRYGPAMDIWAVGCVAIELLTGHPFFPGDNETHQLQLIHDVFGPPVREDVESLIGPIGVHVASQTVFARSSRLSKHFKGEQAGCSLDESLSTAPATNSDDEDCPSWPRHPSLQHWKSKVLPLILHGALSESLSDLLHRLLAYYPVERISAAEALRHPFFSDVSPSSSD